MHDVLVVGAGLGGLACARDLRRAGRRVLLLDKSRGVSGRA
ncbi:FAD-dependent oxidoreductase, partial [Deinococcus pimensis]